MSVKCVTIIGLGLIGGSLAKVLRERCDLKKIIGIDTDELTIKKALNEGILSEGAAKIIPAVSQSDIVFICTPVSTMIGWIEQLAPIVKPGCIITDTGSTKSWLIDAVEQMPHTFSFVGGHPMTGSEKSGYAASQSHLFENAFYILTPCAKTTSDDVKTLNIILRQLGSIPILLPAQLHDKVTGAISHVPHIISAALVNMVANIDGPEGYMQKLAAGGFRDITRISSSNPEMWQNICSSNKDAILQILDNYITILNDFKTTLANDNSDHLYHFFKNAKTFRDSIASKVTGLIPGIYELIIDIIDQPGMIGEIATLLGSNYINIKNINVSNSREFEGGVLIVSLPDVTSMQKAYQILQNHGYQVIMKD